MNKEFFIVLAILIIIYVIYTVRKDKLAVKESFWWVVGSIAMLVLAIFPGIVDWAAGLLGVAYPPTLLLTFCIIFLLFINFRNSRRIADQQVKIVELAQQVALLKQKVSGNVGVKKNSAESGSDSVKKDDGARKKDSASAGKKEKK